MGNKLSELKSLLTRKIKNLHQCLDLLHSNILKLTSLCAILRIYEPLFNVPVLDNIV